MTPDFADWLEIANLKARYCRFLDTRDWSDYAALMTDDVVIDTTGSGGPRLAGRDTVLASVRASLDGAVTIHQVHSPEIAIAGDAATGIWAMHDRLAWPNGRAIEGAGHYHERYVRTADGWRIAESRLTRLRLDVTPPPAG